MSKVLLVLGSNRNGFSYKILKAIDEKLDNSKLIKLKDYNIEFCRGCLFCVNNDHCVINDDLNKVVNEMLDSDIIVFGIPNYFGGMGGFFKNFIDRLHYMYKRGILDSKKFVFIYTSATEDTNYTLDQMTKATSMIEKYLKLNVINRYSFCSELEFDNDKVDEIITFLKNN